jgi:hypothetical protein
LYSELGQKAFDEGQYDECIKYEKKAISLDSTLCSAAGGLALAYLVAGKSEAVDAYIQAIELMNRSPMPKKWFADALHNLDEAKRRFGDLKDFDLIRSLLVNEYEKH